MNKKKISFDEDAFGVFPSDTLNPQSEEKKSNAEGFDTSQTATFDSKERNFEWNENAWSINPDALHNAAGVDTSFDTSAFQYSAKLSVVDDDNAWASTLFPDLADDGFEVDPFVMARQSPQQKVHVTVQEQLSIMFDDVSPDPSSKVTGAIHVSQTTDSIRN
jgi:hypothetical protein